VDEGEDDGVGPAGEGVESGAVVAGEGVEVEVGVGNVVAVWHLLEGPMPYFEGHLAPGSIAFNVPPV
jgi:hypothetical protein